MTWRGDSGRRGQRGLRQERGRHAGPAGPAKPSSVHRGDGRGGFNIGNDMSRFGFEDLSLAECGECPIRRQDCRKRRQPSRQSCLLVSEKLETRPRETRARGVSVSYNQIRADHCSGLRPRSPHVASHASRCAPRSSVRSARLSASPSYSSYFLSGPPLLPSVDPALS